MKEGRVPLKIGNAGGFWGDSPQAPARLVAQQPDLDFLTLDYLAEVSMSIMAIQRKDGEGGYAADFVKVVESLIPLWKAGARVKVVANAGGLNPRGCAAACSAVLAEGGITKRVAVVEGDDVLPLLMKDLDNLLYRNMDSGASLRSIEQELVTANAYLGAEGIAKALALGADIVVTGRVADPSLTVGPCLYHYGWAADDYASIAGATVAGHLIECGTQATGGISTHWLDIPGRETIGFPVVEVYGDGTCVLTKPQGSGGEVSLRTTKEQLLYEIGDPARYLSPDASVSFLGLRLADDGVDRVRIAGAEGSAPPPTYKVSATYRSGYRCDAFLALAGPDVIAKGEACARLIRERVAQGGFELDRFHVDCVGAGALAPGVLTPTYQPIECMLRIAAADGRREALECFAKEIAPLVTAGPQGVTGYITGRPKVRQVFGYWPCLVERTIKVDAWLYNG